jgi:hypothetical protein
MEPIGSFFSSFSIRSCCSAVVVCEVERCFERVLKLFSGVKIKISIGKQNLLKSVEVSLLNIEFLLGMNWREKSIPSLEIYCGTRERKKKCQVFTRTLFPPTLIARRKRMYRNISKSKTDSESPPRVIENDSLSTSSVCTPELCLRWVLLTWKRDYEAVDRWRGWSSHWENKKKGWGKLRSPASEGWSVMRERGGLRQKKERSAFMF